MDGFGVRFDLKTIGKQLKSTLDEAQKARDRQRSFHSNLIDADLEFNHHAEVSVHYQDVIESEKDRSYRILKQHDDVFRSVEGRYHTVGDVKKHPLPDLLLPPMIGLRHGLGSQPAGLVADRAYKPRPRTPPKPPKLPWCGEEEHFYN